MFVFGAKSFLFDKHFTSAISTFLSQLLTFFCSSYRSAFSVTYSMTSGTRKSANCCLNFLLIFSAFALSCKMKHTHEKSITYNEIIMHQQNIVHELFPFFFMKIFSLAYKPVQQLLFLNQSSRANHSLILFLILVSLTLLLMCATFSKKKKSGTCQNIPRKVDQSNGKNCRFQHCMKIISKTT